VGGVSHVDRGRGPEGALPREVQRLSDQGHGAISENERVFIKQLYKNCINTILVCMLKCRNCM
jgi:hypothetical protein